MQIPIVAFYSGDLVVFRSVRAAERYIEPADIRSGACVVVDAEGYPVRASIVRRFLAQTVKLEAIPGATAQPDRLRTALIEFLVRAGRGTPEDLEAKPIGPLLKLVEQAQPS